MKDELKRKAFHLLGFIYLAGLAMLGRFHFLGAAAVLWLVISILEILRLKNNKVRLMFDRLGGGLFREHERHQISGVWWMLAGVMASVWLLKPVTLAATPILYLLLGDSAASLVGRSIKGKKWPGSDKSVSGSSACFLVCLLIGAFTLQPAYGWSLVVAGAVTATLLEMGPVPVNDNFLIPTGVALLFALWTW
jgi:dolichol kinase